VVSLFLSMRSAPTSAVASSGSGGEAASEVRFTALRVSLVAAPDVTPDGFRALASTVKGLTPRTDNPRCISEEDLSSRACASAAFFDASCPVVAVVRRPWLPTSLHRPQSPPMRSTALGS